MEVLIICQFAMTFALVRFRAIGGVMLSKKLLVNSCEVCYERVSGWVSACVSEWVRAWGNEGVRSACCAWVRDVCMSHQSDWGYLKTPNENAPCLRIKVNRAWKFYPEFRTAIFGFLQTKQVFLYWSYSDIADSAYYRLSPGLCRWCQRAQNPIISREIIVFGIK